MQNLEVGSVVSPKYSNFPFILKHSKMAYRLRQYLIRCKIRFHDFKLLAVDHSKLSLQKNGSLLHLKLAFWNPLLHRGLVQGNDGRNVLRVKKDYCLYWGLDPSSPNHHGKTWIAMALTTVESIHNRCLLYYST